MTLAKTEHEAITCALRKALDNWSADGNGPAQTRSPDRMRLSDEEPENTPTSEHGGSPHAERGGAFNAEAAAATASIQDSMTSDDLSGVEKMLTDTSVQVQVDNRKIPDSISAVHAEMPHTTIHQSITPLAQLKEAPYIGLWGGETPENALTFGHSGSLHTNRAAPSALQETAAEWQPHFISGSAWRFPSMGEYNCEPWWDQAASSHSLVSTTKTERSGLNGIHEKATSATMTSELLKHLHRLNSELRI